MILKKAVETYGKDMQLTVAVEEFSELTKEICKSKRGSDNRDNIIEEIADCYIMLDQIKIIFDITPSELSREVKRKLRRLAGRLYKVADYGAANKAEFPKFEFKESENDDGN